VEASRHPWANAVGVAVLVEDATAAPATVAIRADAAGGTAVPVKDDTAAAPYPMCAVKDLADDPDHEPD
jgi:hypothetical protein